ncbi:5-bromo-4-chloroindolyl phosphate hydrolysis protein [Bacillus mesophilus]|uniref:Protein xpaC n=1 Tax=Bacillus mesophilus TaxID=1808955 RepID=A0A6M0QDD6_9BACI|nr:5-bromo-4-chloroindolyl phosphate hydrolysis family protein [Bacillus mesophilus]MBM7660146.1 5-bromo-4-chloroindolyl phosphate hydrolysis protein [Bacillus mesophilus]NEY73799.1 protein xpaC [Bacillus mesophilus]
MRTFLNFFLRSSLASGSIVIFWLISFFGFSQPFLLSSGLALGGGAVVYFGVKGITTQRYLRQNRLTRKEYAYIKSNLEQAGIKIKRLRKSLLTIRTVSSIKQNIEILRVVSKIYSITKNEPRRFYLVEPFYYSHLDSLLEISEKYAFLANQPRKNHELTESLRDTQQTMTNLAKVIDQDLYDILEKDISHLKFELDVAKLSIDKNKK